jgi:hypothetical protein
MALVTNFDGLVVRVGVMREQFAQGKSSVRDRLVAEAR